MNQFGSGAALILTAHFQIRGPLVLSDAAARCANVLAGV